MKVKELIQKLEGFDPEMEIVHLDASITDTAYDPEYSLSVVGLYGVLVDGEFKCVVKLD